MARKKVEGICHICGCEGELSFEHVPPRKAFNDSKLIKVAFGKAFDIAAGDNPKGKQLQRGYGDYTLCQRCNNDTGTWYASKFIDWCEQSMDILIKSNGYPTIITPNYMYPLEILKQIVTMFFSNENERFQEAHPELVKFVLNRRLNHLPTKYRFFIAYNISRLRKGSATSGVLDTKTGNMSVFSEIAFPPFVYIMTYGSPPPDVRLHEISHFSSFKFNTPVLMQVRLPVLPIESNFPGDYRKIFKK